MNNLWQRYTNVLHAKGIRPPCDRWYVIRAEEFLKNHQGKQLTAKTDAAAALVKEPRCDAKPCE